jgi:hypothetical protein
MARLYELNYQGSRGASDKMFGLHAVGCSHIRGLESGGRTASTRSTSGRRAAVTTRPWRARWTRRRGS